MQHITIKPMLGALLIFFVFSLLNLEIANATSDLTGKQLNFKVFLDSKEIGYHQVHIRPTIDGEQVNVEAKFEVKFLFITAFSYLHTAEELWKNGCLQSINTQTTENGDEMFVRSEPILGGLAITSHQSETSLTGCIRSFAYWDHQRLDTIRLLNTQTGQYVPAKFSSMGEVSYNHEGKRVAARQYVLEAENAEINLWYSLDNEWLALRTKVKGGRELAYHRITETDFVKDV